MSHLIKCIMLILLLLSTAVVTGCTTQDQYYYNLRAIKVNVIDKISYRYDEPSDYWQTAKETLELKTGDCEDFAILYTAQLLSLYPDYKDKLSYGWYKSKFSKKEHLVLIIDYKFIADNYGVSDFTTLYRDEYELFNIFPIINSRTPPDFYILP